MELLGTRNDDGTTVDLVDGEEREKLSTLSKTVPIATSSETQSGKMFVVLILIALIGRFYCLQCPLTVSNGKGVEFLGPTD